MSITNQDKPTTTLSNPDRVVTYETWNSNTSTWDTETRNWNEMGTTWTNTSFGATGFLWSARRFPWTEAAPWLSEGGITNIAKP